MIRWPRVFIVTAKELVDTLRDRRTLLMMVLVPALLYPLGGIALTQLTASTLQRIEREGYEVAVQGSLDPPLTEALRRDRALSLRQVPDAVAALSQKGGASASVIVRLPRPDRREVEVLYDAASPRSRAALDHVRKALDGEAAAQRQQRLRRLGLTEDDLAPLRIKERSISTEAKAALSHLAPVLALLLILLSLMGAFYPAIDLVAGERERGTLEPLLATPTSRLEIIVGKYLCLAVLALCTCVLNLLSLGLTTGFLLQRVAPGHLAIRPGLLLMLFLGACPVLLMISAFLLLAAVFARSFKDAQNLMTPVYLGCLLPAMAGLVPETHLTQGTALVPVLNAVLFIKEAYAGTLQLVPGFLALLAGFAYTGAGVAVAARVFDRSALIGLRGEGGVAVLIDNTGPQGTRAITLTGALGLYGLCLAFMLHVAPRLQLANLRVGLMATELILILSPVLLFLALGRIPWRPALGLHPITLRQGLAATIAGIGGIAAGLGLSSLVIERLLTPPPEYLQALQALLPRGPLDMVIMLCIAALLPALCEEVLCRGVVLQAGRRTLGETAAVLLSGLAFAVLHLDPYRFPNTLLLGCMLSLIAVRGGSTLLAMIMHFLNNALALLLGARLEPLLKERGVAVYLGLLLGGLVLYGLGLQLLRSSDRARTPMSGA